MNRARLMIIGIFITVILLVSTAVGYNVIISDESDNQEKSGEDDGNSTACEHMGAEGVSIKCNEGNSGTIQIPFIGLQFLETDEKHHWDMEDGIKKVVARLEWTDTSWQFEFSIGTGECPDSGQAKESGSGNNGTIILNYGDEEGLAEGQWFAHIRSLDKESHRGEECKYSLTITVFECAM